MGKAVVNFAGRDEFHEVSMSQNLLVQAQVHSKSTLVLFDLGAIPNVVPHKMVKKLHLHMQYTNRSIKYANCASEKSVGTLNVVQISMRELLVPLDCLVQ